MMGKIHCVFLLAVLVFAPFGMAQSPPDAKLKSGKEVYQYWCWNCHGTGSGKPGTIALQTKYKGTRPADLEQRMDLIPAVTKAFVRNGISIMPRFRKTEISDADLDALAAYLARNIKARSTNEAGPRPHH